ncbi:MAG: hypothetical protein M1820_001026 [Bogoriella megaspora]|nr:MAG: hypothetical protein M1820_001026 [Bogoriella megaspora]
MASDSQTTRAIVSHGPLSSGQWKLEEVKLRDIGPDELLIDILASGICHTDIHFGDQKDGPGVVYPGVKGHEGSGYVKAIGANVTVAQPGDPVLLSYASCGTCYACKDDAPPYCTGLLELNFLGTKNFSPTTADSSSEPSIAGSFFGQSSFANRTIVSQRSVVNVKGLFANRDELILFSPLGCAVQTGAGTIINVAQARPKDAVVVLGLGGVGLSAVMAAKMLGCHRIVGVDKVKKRLDLARELGATDVIDTTQLGDKTLVERVREVTDGLGASVTMDTTGVTALTMQGVEFSRNHGKIIQVGTTPIDAKADFSMFAFMATGKQFLGAVEGGATSSRFVPQLIEWYHEGKLPLDKLVKTFKVDDWEEAIGEMHTGETIKPVLIW